MQDQQVELDIMVPFWGDPELLRRTVESVLAQTDDRWRMVVVDDAYPDGSIGPWVEGLGHPRVSYVRHESNVGITENYRRSLALASADLVMFLGCDDLLLPDYVRTVLAAHHAYPEADVIQPGVEVIDERDRRTSPLGDRVKRLATPRGARPLMLAGENVVAGLLRANWLYWPSLVFRRSAVERHGFLDGFPIIQDLALEVEILSAGGRLLLLDDVVFRYRRHSASASSSSLLDGTRLDGERRYFALAAGQMRTLGWRRAERAARAHLTSRALAVSVLPAAVRSRRPGAVRGLLHHVVARG